MEVSEKISQLRKDRGLTQVQLAKLVGVTDAAIRSYESGSRKPKEEHLRRMAKALGIRQEALAEYGVTSLNEAMQSVFRMEDSHMRAKPVKRGDQYYITFDEASLRQGIQEWGEHRDRFERGEITQAEYDAWKDRYYLGMRIEPGDDGGAVSVPKAE